MGAFVISCFLALASSLTSLFLRLLKKLLVRELKDALDMQVVAYYDSAI